MALARPETLEWVGEDEENGHRQQVISFADPAGVRVLLSFDAASGLLTKAAWMREHAVVGDTYGENVYLDYRNVNGLMLPFDYVDRVGGLAWQHFTASAIALDVDVPAASFQPPREVATVEPDPGERTVEPLGGDAYLVRGPYNTLFVGFDDHVVVLEAPRDSAYSEQVMALIARTLPGKPIRYVVATHFHSDHLGGIRPFVAAGVTILTTADAAAVLGRVAASPRRLHPDAQSRAPQAPRIETVSGSRALADAHHRVELHDVGPTTHAAQILVAYLPQQRLLFEADLLDVTAPEMVLAGPDGVTLAEKIAALGLAVERIVPVHGVPATHHHLEQALAIRARHVPPPGR
jgi:glyoxylase-like metal-dependent hydrolase (beta-lactamase superfamily II)